MSAIIDVRSEIRRASRRNSLPAAYPRLLMDIVSDRGIDPLRLFEGTRLTPALLDAPDLRVSAQEAARVVFNAFAATKDQSLGLEFGLRSKPTTHGYLGYAAMACGTLNEAIDLVLRYIHIRQRDVSVRRSLNENSAIIHIVDNHPLGPLRHFFIESLTIGILRIASLLIEDPDITGELWFDWPEPDYFAAYKERLWMVKFDMPSVQIRFPQHYLRHPLSMADPIAVKQALVQCERELAISGPAAENLLDRVRDELRPSTEGYPDLNTVASCLFMSDRTLKRKLKARGTGFKALLEEVRHADALKLLENPDLDISQIGTALGYQDAPSFTRAFRRWTGKTPSQLRSQLSNTLQTR
ncbi:MAG: AraC family transcriptional regulator [Nevskiales bacterium]